MYIVILSTTASREEATTIARALVEGRKATCVSVIPSVQSFFRWDDHLEEANEFLLIIKTVSSKFEEVQKEIQRLHSYEVPECISLNIEQGNEVYLRWISDSLTDGR